MNSYFIINYCKMPIMAIVTITFPIPQGKRNIQSNVLSLSKKSKWQILIILAPLKINNLQATENRKVARFKVFRQPR